MDFNIHLCKFAEDAAVTNEIYIDIGAAAAAADQSVSFGQYSMTPSSGCGTLEYEAVDITSNSLFANGKAEVTATSLVFHVDDNRGDYPVGNT